ncbi:MAG: T9SS type A sorting domain-containing protein [Bacteroidales bacterium]|nr:T9SS type A sorting domain-containing protein [Bacteroidales bacterium]
MKKLILINFMLICLAMAGFSQKTISDSFFDHVNYRGAFGTNNDWTAGWANWDCKNTAYGTPDVTVEGELLTSTTWTANHVYLIKGFYYVRTGVTLTIEPGTVIRGDKDTKGTLLIERGAKLMAEGTLSQPIVFTSNSISGERSYGDWGGVVLCGKASINVPGGTSIIEGGPTSVYGGGATPDDADNSGSLKYVRIEFPGIPFVQDKEINGLTLGAVGSSTQLEYIQVSYSGDDSYEWFGGTVNAKHLIEYRGWDDDFDTDFGYRGMIQFAVSLRDKDIADPGSGSNGFESDNDGSGSTNTPVTQPIFSNVSVFGPKYDMATATNSNFKRAMHLRRNTRLNVYNSIFSGFPTGLFIDGTAAQGNATAGDMKLQYCVMSGMGSFFASSFERDFFKTPAFGNDTLATNDLLMVVDPFNLIQPNFLLKAESALISGSIWDNTGLKNDQKKAFAASVYPNPVSQNATIILNLDKSQNVTIALYDILGNKVSTIAQKHYSAGNNEIKYDASSLPKGMYFVRISDGVKNSAVKMLVK